MLYEYYKMFLLRFLSPFCFHVLLFCALHLICFQHKETQLHLNTYQEQFIIRTRHDVIMHIKLKSIGSPITYCDTYHLLNHRILNFLSCTLQQVWLSTIFIIFFFPYLIILCSLSFDHKKKQLALNTYCEKFSIEMSRIKVIIPYQIKINYYFVLIHFDRQHLLNFTILNFLSFTLKQQDTSSD